MDADHADSTETDTNILILLKEGWSKNFCRSQSNKLSDEVIFVEVPPTE